MIVNQWDRAIANIYPKESALIWLKFQPQLRLWLALELQRFALKPKPRDFIKSLGLKLRYVLVYRSAQVTYRLRKQSDHLDGEDMISGLTMPLFELLK